MPTLQAALKRHQAGRYQDAERLYHDVLARDPGNPDALHLLGLLYLDCGRPQPAAGLISQAIQQRPDVPFFYNTLGNAFRGVGKREQALLCFERAIRLKPDYSEAFTNLGSALEESGHPTEAIAFHQRAAGLRPDCAEVHGNLGNAFRSAGRAEEAAAEYATALRLRPDFAEAWMNLGNLYYDRDEYSDAEKHYREALRLNPRLAAARTNLGSALNQMAQFKEAEACCRQALEAMPENALAHANLASVLVVTGRAERAEQHCRRALAIQPGLPEAHLNLGLAFAKLHRLEEAEECCRESVRLRPRPCAYVNLANILQLTGRFDESEECLRQALGMHPNHARALAVMGDGRASQGDLAGALAWYSRALEAAPEASLSRPARAMVWLAMGDFEHGWEEYEQRWRLGDCQPTEFPQPLWSGAPFPGQTVLLHTEQGLGDTLQFIRFAPEVKRLGGQVILACQPSLIPILAAMEGVDRIIPNVGALPEFDYHLPLLSAPRVLGTRENTIPRKVPYLGVAEEARVRACERLAELTHEHAELRVGLSWAGSPKNPDDANRSMRFEQLDPLWRIPGVQFFSLQRGVALPAECPLIKMEGDSDDIAMTAAILSELDLVISVDTMIAHLAGALGRPVWTLLKFAPDWRWMRDREDSPWYPTMRLFRQPRFGAWDEVVRSVAAELSRLSAETKVLK
jgi:tetratricopeptide (TPR) repeat protein